MSVIGIDANPAMRGQKTGTEWYAARLIAELRQLALLSSHELRLYASESLPLSKGEQGGVTILRWPFKRFWTQGRLSWEMLRRPPDVLFVPAHALPQIHPKKIVTTIHDVGFRRFPKLYEGKARRYLEATTKYAVKKCVKIFTPSEFTKAELIELYHASADNIVVTPLAPGQSAASPTQSQSTPKHYFLTVSRLEAKKNIVSIIRAFELFKSRRGVGDPFELVLVGKPGFGYPEIKQAIARSSARASIRELGFVDEATLSTLMHSATAYLYPSWYEGLGISALEAMAYGAPLVASDIAALREAAGEAAIYVSPGAVEDWARAMTRLVDDGERQAELRVLGQSRVAGLSWQKTAELTWNTLVSL